MQRLASKNCEDLDMNNGPYAFICLHVLKLQPPMRSPLVVRQYLEISDFDLSTTSCPICEGFAILRWL